MIQLSAVTPESDEESKSSQSSAVDTLKKRTTDGSIPLAVGAILLVRALGSSRQTEKIDGQVLVATALVGLGLRQRRRHSMTGSDTADESNHHTGTGTSEQRADSHQGDSNPRGIVGEPTTESDSDTESIQFHEGQIDENPSAEAGAKSTGDPRIDDEITEVDLSEASLADEASEAAGPSSVQSQPTQTDEIEPEETPEEDSAREGADAPEDNETVADDKTSP